MFLWYASSILDIIVSTSMVCLILYLLYVQCIILYLDGKHFYNSYYRIEVKVTIKFTCKLHVMIYHTLGIILAFIYLNNNDTDEPKPGSFIIVILMSPWGGESPSLRTNNFIVYTGNLRLNHSYGTIYSVFLWLYREF